MPSPCKCGKGYVSAYDNKCGHCRTKKEQQAKDKHHQQTGIVTMSNTPKPLIYAGIGSQETPLEICKVMFHLAQDLAPYWTLRSGGAKGADTAFQLGAEEAKGKMEIYLPWKGFGTGRGKVTAFSHEAVDIAKHFHPAWSSCSSSVKKLHTRNVYQVVGEDLNTKVDMVICWTRGGKRGGGTGQALRMAEHLGIPIFDLALQESWQVMCDLVTQKENEFLQSIEITVVNRHHGTKGEYIGRGTPLGNPFQEGTREENIAAYRNWLYQQIRIGNARVIAELDRLALLAQQGPLALVCSCAPLPCHGDVVKEVLLSALNQTEDKLPWED